MGKKRRLSLSAIVCSLLLVALAVACQGESGFRPQKPHSLCIDGQGRIYFTDSELECIVRMDDMSGTNAVVWGGKDSEGITTWGPLDLGFDLQGRILFTDVRGRQVVRIDGMDGKGLVVWPRRR